MDLGEPADQRADSVTSGDYLGPNLELVVGAMTSRDADHLAGILPALAAAYVLVMAVGGPLAARAADPHRRGAPTAA